ncbi:hypothetical protein BD414DRAFT_510245 [Trametes punicea]|nr:hypothetical protein BD414DRAFT_510245 [Trametes punicea]
MPSSRGSQPDSPSPLGAQVLQRLQLKLPDHYPEDPYKLEDVYNAAKFVLHSTVTAVPPPAHAITSASSFGGTTVKIEDFTSLLHMLTQAASEGTANVTTNMANCFANPAQGAPGGAPRYQGRFAQGDQRNTGVQGNFCHYCGNPGCQLRNCPFIKEDICAGHCMHNQDGRVVLPNGNFVPWQLPGFNEITMHDHIYKWHCRNLNGLTPPTANQMVLSITTEEPRYAATSSFMLSMKDRIEQLERKLFALQQARYTRFDGAHVPLCCPQHSHTSSPPDHERGRSRKPCVKCELLPHLPNSALAWQHEPAVPQCKNQEARDAQPKPVHDPPQPSEPPRKAQREVPQLPTPGASAPVQPQKPSKPAEHPFVTARDAMYAPSCQLNFGQPMSRPKSGDCEPAYRMRAPIQQEEVIHKVEEVADQFFFMVVPDPYELTVVRESHTLRSIVGPVDNKEYIEAIVDLGCQVTAMSENICHALTLAYDPTDKSLSLICNVPFAVVDIVLYLQIYVIRKTVYDMLLGRPFNILTRSIVKNCENEEQTITICCPNTGQLATVPTIARRQARF